jgi:hypothetical protein
MNERPDFSGRLAIRVRAMIVMTMVMLAVILVAGCSDGKYVQEQDIRIVKINPDGTSGWTQTIDYGNDEEMRDIIQTDDGGFIIAGGSSPERGCNSYSNPDPVWYIPNPRVSQLIDLSGTGDILWLRNYSFNGDGGFVSVFRNPDRSLNGVTKNGELWHLAQDGSVISNRSINITSINSAVKFPDGEYGIVSGRYLYESSGSNISLLDPDGTIKWSIWFNESRFNQVSPVVKISDHEEYLFSATHYNDSIRGSDILIARLDHDGSLQSSILVAQVKYVSSEYGLESSVNGYTLGYNDDIRGNSSTTDLVKIDKDGTVTGTQSYFNRSSAYIPTMDGGFLSVHIPEFNAAEPDVKKPVSLIKTDKDGTIEWKNRDYQAKVGEWGIRKIIPTSDGGFAIMMANKKMSRC